MAKMIDIFMAAGRVKRPDSDEHENVVAIERNQAVNAYEEVFRDQLDREDIKFMALRYPETTCDPRRRQELAEGGMIKEDRGAMSNLPRRAIHHEYPRLGYYSNPFIDSLSKVKSRKGGR